MVTWVSLLRVFCGLFGLIGFAVWFGGGACGGVRLRVCRWRCAGIGWLLVPACLAF